MSEVEKDETISEEAGEPDFDILDALNADKQKKPENAETKKAVEPPAAIKPEAVTSKKPAKPKETETPYYMKLSRRVHRIKLLVCVLLIAFVITMLVLFRDSITVENFRYFLRFVDTRQAMTDELSSVKYDSANATDFAVFRGGLLVLDPDTVSLYDLNGDNIYSVAEKNAAPVCAIGEKSCLVYNIGGYTFQVFDSLAEQYKMTLDYPISTGAVSDNGVFLIGTKSMEYRSVVNVYSETFEKIYEWSSPDKYLMGADINAKGDAFVTASLSANTDGSSNLYLSMYRLSDSEVAYEASFRNLMPLSVKYNTRGGVTMLTDQGVYTFDDRLKQTSYTSYDGYVPTRAETDGEYTCFILNKNVVGSEYEAVVLNRAGEKQFGGTITGEITDFEESDGLYYFLLERQLACADPATGTVTVMDISSGGISLKATEDNLLICMQGKTEVLSKSAFHAKAQKQKGKE